MRRLHSTWRVLGVTLALGILGACQDDADLAGPPERPAPAPNLAVTSTDADIEGSLTGSYRARHPEAVCTLDGGPVVIEGSIDIESLDPNYAIMVGLVDKGFHEADPTGTWGSGAYAYFGHIGSNLRIGPSDGYDTGGELNQVGVNVPFPASLPVTIDFTLTVDASTHEITLTYGGTDYVDDYGAIEDAGIADAYPGGEFDGGAIIGVDIFDTPASVTYRLEFVSGCTVIAVDDEGPVTLDVEATPNPAAIDAMVTLAANVDDQTTGGSDISAAEYTLDGGATWTPMSAADGMFDEVVEGVTTSFAAPADAGLYEVCVRGTDEPGNTGEQECITLVTYDPAGGFVTGGGWIDSPAGAFMPGDATAVTPANLGVDWFLTERTGSDGTFVVGPDTPPLGDGSLSMSLQDGSGKVTLFNYDHIGTPLTDIESISYSTYRSSASTNPTAQFPALNLEVDFVGDGSSYTTLVFEPVYAFGQSALMTDTWQTWDAMAPSQTSFGGGWWSTRNIPGVCAFNCFVAWDDIVAGNPNAKIVGGFGVNIGSGWNGMFSGASDALSLTVDGSTMTYDFEADAPFDPVGRATFGFVSKYRKGAQTPDGNTEFRFRTADLDFHSTSYDWLVVNQGGENAQFKGDGTINGTGDYRFMLWAGDHDDGDTFRIRITDAVTDEVVYDNGMSQPIGGGSIIVHDGKKNH